MDQLSKEAQAALKNANSSYMLISGVDKKAYQALEEEFSVHGYCLDDLLKLYTQKDYSYTNLEQTITTHLRHENYAVTVLEGKGKEKVTSRIKSY